MSESRHDASERPSSGRAPSLAPCTALGWVAVCAAGLGAIAWLTLPVIAGLVGDANPSLSSGAMITGMVLLVGAAVFNVIALALLKERSVLNIVAAAVAIPALLLVLMLALGGFFNGWF